MAPLHLSAFALLGLFKPAKVFITNLINSFTNSQEGFSARKLSAFAGVSIAAYLSKEHSSEVNVGVLVIYWLLFALLCMSIITFEQIIKLKNGKDEQ